MGLTVSLLLVLGLSAAFGAPDYVSVHPVARVEGRPTGMDEIDAALADPARLKATRLVFVGDSITAFWPRSIQPGTLGQNYGRKSWNESFATQGSENYALNLGVAGDRTEHVLYRILPSSKGGLGELDSPQLDPDVIVLMIGINNAWAADKLVADSMFAGVAAVLAALHERKPRARIVVQSLLPTTNTALNRIVLVPANKRLQALARMPTHSDYLFFLDLYPAFLDATGQQDHHFFNDYTHPNEAGYRLWRDRLLPFLGQMRK